MTIACINAAQSAASWTNRVRRFATLHKGAVCFLAGLLPVLIRLSVIPYVGIPEPYVHDEFSYLLGAETFAEGRLANSPHPMWIHFETFHVNQQPTYSSKYPPGQALILAGGQILFGHPWFGVLLSLGLMCGCLCWMLQGWLPSTYVLIGSAFAISQFSVTSNWVNSYWGGALTAAGGALVLGALPRLARAANPSVSALGATGAAILANTRPFEGLIVFGTSAAALIWWRWRKHSVRDLFAGRILFPAVAILGVVFVWMGYYNYRVSGSPWIMPYTINQATYSASPHFWLLPDKPVPSYHHEVLRQMWVDWDRKLYFEARAEPYLPFGVAVAIILTSMSVPLSFAFLTAVILVSNRKAIVAKLILAALAFGLAMEKSISFHYVAPATALIVFLSTTGCRYVVHRFNRHAIRARGAILLTLLLLAFLADSASAISFIRRSKENDFVRQHREIVADLMKSGPKHLVIVKYRPDHNFHVSWVNNRADIDASDIVWAQDMGKTGNQEILNYYPDRQVWLLEPDVNPPKLSPY